jgi:hypothetical protein
MNQDKEPDPLDKLFAAGRAAKPDTAPAEYAFETRVVARIQAERRPLPWFALGWRLAPVFGAIVLALGVWSVAGLYLEPADLRTAIGSGTEESALVAHFTGE